MRCTCAALRIAWKDVDGDQGIYWSSFDGSSWVNVSLTFSGLKTLFNAHSTAASDISTLFGHFALGPASDESTFNNGDKDPNNPNDPNNLSDPKTWKFGSDGRIHAMLNIQSDAPNALTAKVQEMKALASKHGVMPTPGVDDQPGETLPKPLTGHEHFGFKDGISQPGVANFDPRDPNDPSHVLGHPGTEIINAGEFVLGEDVENDPSFPEQKFSPPNIPTSLSWMQILRNRSAIARLRDRRGS